MGKCTNHFLPVGYELKDDRGYTIAVLGEDRCFHLWESGSWLTKLNKKIDRIRSPRRWPSVRRLARQMASDGAVTRRSAILESASHE